MLDTILVTDNFPVSSVTVGSVSLHHDLADTLELSLAHVGGPDVMLAPAVLRPAADAAPAACVYEPEAVVATTSAGQWVLRIMDKQPGAAR
jgi:subtilisin-like proprotein convertase family protein